jgi:hypothetical protein
MPILDDIVAIDPLYVLLGPKIFELLHRPDPPPIDVITARVQDAVKHMSADDKKAVLAKCKMLGAYIGVLQKAVGGH